MHSDSQIVLLDEYSKAHFHYTILNAMADGTYLYPVKCGRAVKLNDPIIIICGNISPQCLHPNKFNLIEARFNIFEIPLLPDFNKFL